MPKRYIPCRYTYLKGTVCQKVKKNTDKATVQNNYNVGSRAELLSNMFKQAEITSTTKQYTKIINKKTGFSHNSAIIPYNSKTTKFIIK